MHVFGQKKCGHKTNEKKLRFGRRKKDKTTNCVYFHTKGLQWNISQHVSSKPPYGKYNIHSSEQFLSNYLSLTYYIPKPVTSNMAMLQR